jgi:glycosyltransferase involved in cell wall biosynthesis
MGGYDLSVIIPARNEEFLGRTIQEVLTKRRGRSEVICVLDGAWPVEPLEDHPDVTLIHHAEAIGQRAAINEAARLSTAKFVMKLDAHCALDEGFDVKLMEECDYDWTVVPRLYNLHAFDWGCKACGYRTYQGPKPTVCSKCSQAAEHERVMVWQPRLSRKTDSMRFDKDLIFKYWGEYTKRSEAQGEIADTMSLLGACYFMHRKRFWELGGSDVSMGSWGQQGTEESCKAWLSGGRLVVNKRTWYSHLFRTQPGFNFPYPMSQSAVEHARDRSRDIWLNNKWKKQVRPLSWLIDKFAPVPSWNDEEGKAQLEAVQAAGERFYAERKAAKPQAPAAHTGKPKPSKGIVYVTENRCPEPIFSAVQRQLGRVVNGHRIVSVSLAPVEFGENIVLGLQPGPVTLFRQILAGLAELDTDYVFIAEHDCLYPKEHFEFTPECDDAFYYDQNTWKVCAETGRAVFYYTQQVSGLCANRELLIGHYRRRIERCEKNAADLRARGEEVKRDGFSQYLGWEPGNHTPPRGVDDYPALSWFGARPIVDIRHSRNTSKTRWSPDEFRDKRTCEGWQESDRIDGWGVTKGRFNEFLQDVVKGKIG